MHEYQRKSFTPEQEVLLRASAGPGGHILDFFTEKEFNFCRKMVMHPIDYPEHGQVSKYWGFGWDTPTGQLLKWIKPKIDEIFDNWELDFFAIQEAITPWKLHADIRWYNNKIPYKVLLMPMDVEPMSGPVPPSEWPDTYSATFHQRNFLSRWAGQDLTGNSQTNWARPLDNNQYEEFVPGYHVTHETWQTHFSHFPYSHLEGLTLEGLHKWIPKSLVYWDNTSVHCADNFLANGIKTKRSLMLFTTLK